MLTEAKAAANRENAKKSTGPRTAAGKATVARNAIVHGFYCKHTIIQGECALDLERLRFSIVDRLKPADDLENCYVERVVVNAWKLRRALAAEKDHAKLTRTGESPDYLMDWTGEATKLSRHCAGFERAMDRALNQLEKLRKSRAFNESESKPESQNLENKPTDPEDPSNPSLAPSANPPDSVLSPQHSVLSNETNPPPPEPSTEFEIASSYWLQDPKNKPTVESEIDTIDRVLGCAADQEMLS